MSRFRPKTLDFGHAMIAPIDQRLPRDTFDWSTGAGRLSFPAGWLAWQRRKGLARHRQLSPLGRFVRSLSKNPFRPTAWISGGEKLGSCAVRARVFSAKARINIL